MATSKKGYAQSKGRDTKTAAKAKVTKEVKTPTVSDEQLESAKAELQALQEEVGSLKKAKRQYSRTVKNADKRKKVLKEKIAKTRDQAGRQLEVMQKKIARLKAMKKELKPEVTDLHLSARVVDKGLEELRDELMDARSEMRDNMRLATGEGATDGAIRRARNGMVKSLAKRTYKDKSKWAIEYDKPDKDGNTPIVGANKDGVRVEFGAENWTIIMGKDKKSYSYGKGAVNQAVQMQREYLRMTKAA